MIYFENLFDMEVGETITEFNSTLIVTSKNGKKISAILKEQNKEGEINYFKGDYTQIKNGFQYTGKSIEHEEYISHLKKIRRLK